MSGLFSLDKVKISYGKNEIVHGVSMDIAKGEFCALLGLNGSGKTTPGSPAAFCQWRAAV